MVNKTEIRRLYLQKRRELAPEEVEEKARAILANFAKLDFTAVRYLHLFYPIADKVEFDSLILAGWLRDNHPAIKLVLSRSNLLESSLTHFVWEADTILNVNKWGITEPESGTPVSPDQLDMIIIPLLAFDKKGNRVGYGKGFYDRFLSECNAAATKAGISFFPPVEKVTDINQFDIPLDLCITPEKTWHFKESI